MFALFRHRPAGPQDPDSPSSAPRRIGPFGPFLSGLGAGAAIVLLAALLLRSGGTVDRFPMPSLPELRADLGDGDFLFFPNRRSIWVVQPHLGRLIHYRFLDTTDGTIEKSFVAEIDQKLFPPEDTVYALSERNITDLLWVANRRTGNFQLWRRSVRDGRLVTDPTPVNAARDLVTSPAIRSSQPPSRP